MKVLYLYEGLPTYRKDFLNLLNKKLKEKGHTLKLLYAKPLKNNSLQLDEELDFDSATFPVKKKAGVGVVTFPEFVGMYDAFIKESPDVYVLQFHVALLTYWRIYFYAKRHSIPYITWDCNWLRDDIKGFSVKLRKYFVDKTYKNASVCISYGTRFGEYLKMLGKADEDVVVAQNTINVERILDNRSPQCGRRDFNHPIHFLYVGVINSRKYLNIAIRAVAILIHEGRDIYLDIVGNGDSFGMCKDLIEELGVGERVVLHGAKHGKEVQDFFEKSDVFVLPGTGGLAINEALAYSLPIISTDGDGTVVDLLDGNGYFLEHMGDVEELTSCMKAFLNLSADEKRKMADRSEQIIRERATLENMANQHLKAIERALGKVE